MFVVRNSSSVETLAAVALKASAKEHPPSLPSPSESIQDTYKLKLS